MTARAAARISPGISCGDGASVSGSAVSVELPDSLTRYIEESVDWIIDMDFPELVRAIYCLFPEYQENSRFAYDEEQAIIETFARGLKHSREGETHTTADVLAALQQT